MLTIASYVYTDFVHATDYDAEKSLYASLKFSAVGYGVGAMHRVPGLEWTKVLGGTELKWDDIKMTVAATVVGSGGDFLEQYLSSLNTRVVDNATAGPSAASGKTIVSSDN